MSETHTLLVTGAAGQLGQLVLKSLVEMGANVIATTRQPEKLAEFAAQGVAVRAADFNQPESLSTAFAGATRMLLISTDAVGARIEQHRQAIQAAVAAGVKHIVYTSWPDAENSPALVAPDHAATEKLIRESGLSYTFLGNNLYSENLLMSLPTALETGVLAGSTGGAKTAYVSRLDCARAAAFALNSTQTENQVLEISGPAAYSHAEIAQMLNDLTGKNVQALDLSDEAYHEALVGAGLPEFVAALFVSFDKAVRWGDAARVSTAVQDLTGLPPQDLRAFLSEHFGQ